MRKLFAGLGKDLRCFIEQRDDLMLLANCNSADSALVLQTLRDIEQESGTDVFLLFADNFVEPESFVSVAIDRLKEDHRLACEGLAEEGRPSLPPMPASLFDHSRPAATRLPEAIGFARSLLPTGGDHRLVWAMFPLEIADWAQYLQLVSMLAPWKGVKPQMRGVRLLFRYQRESDPGELPVVAAPRVRVQDIDLGPAAIEASLLSEAEDPELSDEERMQALLTAAYMDSAYNRSEAAISKFNLLLGYYQHTGNLLVQALVIKGLGDVAHRNNSLEQAQRWYECALLPASEAKEASILAELVKDLGEIAYQQRRYADAEQYFDGLDKLRAHLLDPEGKAQALEWRGLSQEKLAAYDRAGSSWEGAAQLCRSIGLPHFLRTNLQHLARIYRETRMTKRLSAVEAELRQLNRETTA
jgi:tetratricopeptide (TPR) repeat protein